MSETGGSGTRDPTLTIARILRATVIAVGVIALIWMLSDAFLVIFLAVLMATMLRGLGSQLHRHTGLPIGVAVLVVFLLLLALVFGAADWIGPRLASEGQQLWKQVSGQIGGLQTFMHRFGLDPVVGGNAAGGISLPHDILRVASSTVSLLAAILVVVVTAVYLAASPAMYITGAVHLTPRWYHERARGILLEMGTAMQGWLLGQLIDMVVVGVIVGAGLTMLNAPLALVLGVIAGLFTFVPYFGTIISAIPALLIGFTVSMNEVLWILGLFVVAHVIEGYVIAPFVQRRTVHLPPALTVLGIVVLTAFFGILGVLIATPMIAVLLVGVTRIYVEDILGDQKAGHRISMRTRWYWFTPPDPILPGSTPLGETEPRGPPG